MGIEDRDYFREDHAEKNGMRYNRKNATYSSAEKLFEQALQLKPKRRWHPVLTWLMTAVICLLVFVLLKLITRFA